MVWGAPEGGGTGASGVNSGAFGGAGIVGIPPNWVGAAFLAACNPLAVIADTGNSPIASNPASSRLMSCPEAACAPSSTPNSPAACVNPEAIGLKPLAAAPTNADPPPITPALIAAVFLAFDNISGFFSAAFIACGFPVSTPIFSSSPKNDEKNSTPAPAAILPAVNPVAAPAAVPITGTTDPAPAPTAVPAAISS